VNANTTGSGYDTVIAVYTGTQNSLTPLANSCTDDANNVVTSQVSFTATTPNVYWMMVSAFAGDTGTLTFHLETPKRRGGQITSQ
jgi:hypothetical protein